MSQPEYWTSDRLKEQVKSLRHYDVSTDSIENGLHATSNTTHNDSQSSISSTATDGSNTQKQDTGVQTHNARVVEAKKVTTPKKRKVSKPKVTRRQKKPLVDVIAQKILGNPRNMTDPLVDDPMGFVTLDYKKKLDLHCSNCALISSSGHILHSKAGKEIDQHQCIFRMNNNPTVDYSNDVGQRTTLRYIAHSSLGHVVRTPNAFFQGATKPKYVVVWGPVPTMRNDGTGKTFNNAKRLQKIYRDVEFYVETSKEYAFTSIIFERIALEKRTGNWLTTGWRTMMLALNTCDNVTVYGMAKYDTCRKPHKKSVPFHYFGAESRTECSLYERSERYGGSGHRFETEKLIFEYLSHLYNITFRYPSWNSTNNFGVK
ncbi:alpha-N-acetylgalactosaminide alpha-2,6-sialyltransferase 3-like isoform X2 [Glandiceps talaboti]